MKILLILIILYLLPLTTIRAQAMNNDSFKVNVGDLDPFDEPVKDDSGGVNFSVQTGFPNIPSLALFSFGISENLIDYGNLTPTNPVTRKSILTVENESAPGYIVMVSQNHQLLDPNKASIIADTTCDTGNCSENIGASWIDNLAYGFGYRCDSKICLEEFKKSSFFLQFADESKSESKKTVISGSLGKKQTAEILYKVNIPSSQKKGVYKNTVSFIAVPIF